MDRVERDLGPSGYLVGDRFSVADLAGASLSRRCSRRRPSVCAGQTVASLQDFHDELLGRPGGEWVYEMYARHRGAWVPA